MSYDWCWVYENPKEAAAALDDLSTWNDRHTAEIESLQARTLRYNHSTKALEIET